MLTIHPEYLMKNGQKEFVVLTYDEFTKIQEIIDDYEDLIELRKVKDIEGNEPTVSLDEIKSKYGIN